MRKILPYPAVLLGILVLLQSCSKKDLHNDMVIATPLSQIVNVKVAPGSMYQLNLNNLESVNINKQAVHYEVSKTELDTKSGLLVYKYKPAAGFTGADEVVLKSTKTVVTSGNGGCHNNSGNNSGYMNASYSTTYITVKINVIN